MDSITFARMSEGYRARYVFPEPLVRATAHPGDIYPKKSIRLVRKIEGCQTEVRQRLGNFQG
jgi:hypothetical protein